MMKFLASSQQRKALGSYGCHVGQSGSELVDVTLQDEIELVGDLVVAAGASPEHMTDADIDRILGIEPRSLPEPNRGGGSSRRRRRKSGRQGG